MNPKLSCPRPLGPVLYYSDVTSNPSERYPAGDWQMGGTAVLPDKVCGMYFYFNKTLLSNTPSMTSYFLLSFTIFFIFFSLENSGLTLFIHFLLFEAEILNVFIYLRSLDADGTWSFTNTGGYCSTCGVPPPTSNYNPAYGSMLSNSFFPSYYNYYLTSSASM